jgi:hypothetical protein
MKTTLKTNITVKDICEGFRQVTVIDLTGFRRSPINQREFDSRHPD